MEKGIKRGKQRRLEKGCTNVKGEPDQGWRKEEDPDCEPDNMPRTRDQESRRSWRFCYVQMPPKQDAKSK